MIPTRTHIQYNILNFVEAMCKVLLHIIAIQFQLLINSAYCTRILSK